MNAPFNTNNELGGYLKDRRTKLDPAAFGFSSVRRRTPGLRREEVAQRANISATWYTWLEQGRGGGASADVLDRIARALMLTDAEREHLFLLGLGRPPELRYQPADDISPRLQRVLDALEPSPALVKTATWGVVAWNRAAALMLTDYALLPPAERNILRLMFCEPRVREAQEDWESVARFVVAAFRADAARAGASEQMTALVEELRRESPEFAAMWRDNNVLSHSGGIKRIRHAVLGLIALEYSVFSVDGRPDLQMLVYNATTPEDAERMAALIPAKASAAAN